MKIFINEDINPEIWNKFAGDNIFFRFEWYHIISSVFNKKPFFILATDEKNMFALIPSFKVSSKYISMPYIYMSGFLYNDKKALSYLEEYLNKNKIFIEYKKIVPLVKDPKYVTSIVEMKSYEDLFKNLSSNMRNQIRKSKKNDLNIKFNELETFYRILSIKMHQLGTPIRSKEFFKLILENYNEAKIITAYKEKKAIGSLLYIDGKSLVNSGKCRFILWAATLQEYDNLYTNYFLYSYVFEDAEKNDIIMIDLGTSQFESSQFKFKQKWKPNNYSVKFVNRVDQEHHKSKKINRFLSFIWKRLPYKMTLLLGPQVRKVLI